MTNMPSAPVELIPIEDIHILNPRDRDKAKFQCVVDSISAVGLKRPIKLSPRRHSSKADQRKYNLVCGQGRLEAFKRLGEKKIPAIIVELSEEECYLQSLIENVARRYQTPLELVHDIGRLAEQGYNATEIAKKTGLSREYIADMIRLLECGEERLLAAVEKGQIPVYIAVEIASTDDEGAQLALTRAYERNELRGRKFRAVVQLLKERGRMGKSIIRSSNTRKRRITSQAIVKEYKRETERQRTLIMRADVTEARLAIIKTALQTLLAEENFATLLRAEGLDTMPSQVAEMLDTPAATFQ